METEGGLRGKVTLVMGGSRGIGAAIAKRFGALGGHVSIGYQSRSEAADAIVSEIAAAGGQAMAAAGDVADPEAVGRVVAETVARFGRIDVLVNTAAIGPYRPVGQLDAPYVRRIFDTNVLGTILVTEAVLPHMPSPGGRIIYFSSRLAFSPIPTSSVYSASKSAVVTLALAFSKELGPRGITVNTVAPGVIETDMTKDILAERGAAILASTPLGRIGQPDDIAGIATFLASPEAGWITGRTIVADGGVL